MINIALYEPEIPPNTGNVIRLCANTGAALFLVGKLGFDLDDKRLRRAGLDYHEWAQVIHYESLEILFENQVFERVFAITTKGRTRYSDVEFRSSDLMLFGPETRGLPDEVLDSLPSNQKIRLPMLPNSRSLNLSNAVSILTYEAWRQQDFMGGT